MKKVTFLMAVLVLIVSVSGVAAAPLGQDGEAYVVQADDWLSKIAERFYGDPLTYPTIVEGTNAKAAEDDSFAVIEDPDVIEIGQKLWIPPEPVGQVVAETTVLDIALAGPLADRNAEISGMAWYGDNLIILPQYPNFSTESEEGYLYTIPKEDIMAAIDGSGNDALEAVQIPFIAPGLQDEIVGFEGYEAIAFIDDNAYITIEAETDDGMVGYVVKGAIAPDLSALTVDTTTRPKIAPQSEVGNMSEESLLVIGDNVATIYEVNGVALNTAPAVHLFDSALAPAGTVPMAAVEYRVTDVTTLDGNNRFWAINYFFPGEEELLPETDPIVETYGEGATHYGNAGVERLIELQYDDAGITLADTPPIQMTLLEEDLRNWEGIVRVGDQGFLVATDKYPGTILAFVPLP